AAAAIEPPLSLSSIFEKKVGRGRGRKEEEEEEEGTRGRAPPLRARAGSVTDRTSSSEQLVTNGILSTHVTGSADFF
ncbi:hypothetical protein PSY31_23465, partial [Shigella flexneri]|nr:hypothetical protein [Shigella flexneri]